MYMIDEYTSVFENIFLHEKNFKCVHSNNQWCLKLKKLTNKEEISWWWVYVKKIKEHTVIVLKLELLT